MIKIIFFLVLLNIKGTDVNFTKKGNNLMELTLIPTKVDDYFSKTSKPLDVTFDGVVKETTSILSNLYKFPIKQKLENNFYVVIKVFFDEGCILPIFFTRKKSYLTEAIDLITSRKLLLTSSNFGAKELNLKTDQTFKITELEEKPPKNLLNQILYIKDEEEHEGIIYCPLFVQSKTVFSFRVDAEISSNFKEHFDKKDHEKKFNIIIPAGEKITKKFDLKDETEISFVKSSKEIIITFHTSTGREYQDDGSIFFLENVNFIEIVFQNPTKNEENVDITYITSDCIDCFGEHKHKKKGHLVAVFVILAILLILIIVGLLYYYYSKKKKNTKEHLSHKEENEFKVEVNDDVEEIDINDKELQKVYKESLTNSQRTFDEKDMKFYK